MTRSGFAAVVGATNCGKSTLVNALVGQKVSIVTHKAQTTRFKVRGVFERGECQVVIVDTPGIFAPRRRLDRAMVRAARSALDDADAIVHLIDAARPERAVAAEIGRMLSRRRERVLLVLNKIDKLPRTALLPLADELFAEGERYSESLMISALTGEGVEDLARRLAAAMPEGPWLYPAGARADQPLSRLASEITREKLFLRVHQELPYEANVETTGIEERKDGSVRIDQTIEVERAGQRKIVL
ncbi:MAG: GTPase Era, partial [Caulobacteraceae bacterium]